MRSAKNINFVKITVVIEILTEVLIQVCSHSRVFESFHLYHGIWLCTFCFLFKGYSSGCNSEIFASDSLVAQGRSSNRRHWGHVLIYFWVFDRFNDTKKSLPSTNSGHLAIGSHHPLTWLSTWLSTLSVFFLMTAQKSLLQWSVLFGQTSTIWLDLHFDPSYTGVQERKSILKFKNHQKLRYKNS